MLTIFKSSAGADVVMFEENAKETLSVLGKNSGDAQGVVTVEQLPDAIAKLKAAVAGNKEAHPQPRSADEEAESGPVVSFSQRAIPLLALLERSLEEKLPVTWGIQP